MVLGKLPVPGRPTILITVGQGPTALAVGAGGGGLDIFTLIYPFSSFSLSLETARYRLKYCLKGPLNPKQPTNQNSLNVYKTFDIKSLGEYHDLYLKTDVVLLCDIFEQFRNVCMGQYGLDPCHFYTVSGLAWSACLKKMVFVWSCFVTLINSTL